MRSQKSSEAIIASLSASGPRISTKANLGLLSSSSDGHIDSFGLLEIGSVQISKGQRYLRNENEVARRTSSSSSLIVKLWPARAIFHRDCPFLHITMMSRIGQRLLSVVKPGSSFIFGRCISTTRPVLGLSEFFELGKALPVFEPGKAPAYGRAWKADELRIKSFEDLHKLWFVLLKERNILATQKAEAQRLGQRWFGNHRVFKTKLSMTRIKTVLMERLRMHSQAKHMVAVKNGEKRVPEASEVLLAMQKKERLQLVDRKRQFRKKKRFLRRQHPLF